MERVYPLNEDWGRTKRLRILDYGVRIMDYLLTIILSPSALSLQACLFPDKWYDVDSLMSELARYTRKPGSLLEEVVETFSTTS